ncbi:hypothetical protein AB833_11560 [Chromatiales bacterium (ex Bugula neritina AB1)]|nr:hypothetical protein AB833_11560 [Chromatiales bacterium (ex Bugula neritina AB1)]
MKKQQTGFTLIELMIVIAIIGLLISVAIPQYTHFIKRGKFSDVVTQTNVTRKSVELCILDRNTPGDCDGGEHGTIENYTGSGNVESIDILDGVITATGSSALDNRTLILTPIYDGASNSLIWEYSGTCYDADIC